MPALINPTTVNILITAVAPILQQLVTLATNRKRRKAELEQMQLAEDDLRALAQQLNVSTTVAK